MVSVKRDSFEAIGAALFACTVANAFWFGLIAITFRYGDLNANAFIIGVLFGMMSCVFLSGYILIFVYRKDITEYVYQQRVVYNAEQELEKLKKELLEKISKQIKTQ